jgi:flagellin
MSVTLNAASQSALFNLQEGLASANQVSSRLNSGKEVNSASDDPLKYFTALGLDQDADDFSRLKDTMNSAAGVIDEAINGIDGITKLVNQMQGLIDSAGQTADAATRTKYAASFGDLRTKIDNMATDAKLNGKSLISSTGSNMEITFNREGTSKMTVIAARMDATGGATITAAANNWATAGDVSLAQASVKKALTTLRAQAQTLGTNLAVLNTRIDFTTKHIQNDQKASATLTLADMNKEGAALGALRTRQQFSLQNLVMAGQQDLQVLSLLR